MLSYCSRSIVLLVLVLQTITTSAQSVQPDSAFCPLDGTPVLFWRTLSMTTKGSLLDLEKQVDVPGYYAQLMVHCPRCRYSGYYSDFKKTFNNEQRRQLQTYLDSFARRDISDVVECEIAAGIHRLWHDKNERIAGIYLEGSYLLRFDTLHRKERINLQLQACRYFQRSLDAGEILPENRVIVYYLMGDLYRRTGRFTDALRHFAIARKLGQLPAWIAPMMNSSEAMARAKNADNSK